MRRQPKVGLLERYYRGDHPLPAVNVEAAGQFRRMLEQSVTNWMGLVVDATAERLHVIGFKFGDDTGDQDAWALWQRNNLDAQAELLHVTAGTCGEAYTLVWTDERGAPQITVEHPCEVIVETDPANPRRRLAAVKTWSDTADGDKVEYCTLWTPEAMWRWHRPSQSGKWEPRTEDGTAAVVDNPVGAVPVVPFVCRPTMRPYGGRSEIEDVTPIQDRLNATLFDRLLSAEFSAFRQRWATGLEIPTDPETNRPVEPFKHAIHRLWVSEDPETKFGEFGETDLSGFIAAVEADVQHLAAITRTPPHYLLGQSGAFPSGESLKSTETGLVAKVRRRQLHYGESWEETMRLAFAILGDSRAEVADAETVWDDPESRTEGEHVDALLKRQALGVPQEQLWLEGGYSPQDVARFRRLASQDAMRQALAKHPPPPELGEPDTGEEPEGTEAA